MRRGRDGRPGAVASTRRAGRRDVRTRLNALGSRHGRPVRRLRRSFAAVLGLVALLTGLSPVFAGSEQVLLDRETFLAEAFDGMDVPAPRLVWLAGSLRERVIDVLGHPPDSVRLRYWRQADRTAWILDEIGKERPITVGIAVDAGQVRSLRILVYRESRGWEVRHEFFTRQFDGADLTDRDKLSRPIDNISGATLSVSAVSRLARVALLLDQHVRGS